MHDAEWTDQWRGTWWQNKWRLHQRTPPYFAAQGWFRNDSNSGSLIDSLLYCFDVVELGGDVDVDLMAPEESVYFSPGR